MAGLNWIDLRIRKLQSEVIFTAIIQVTVNGHHVNKKLSCQTLDGLLLKVRGFVSRIPKQ